MLLRTQSLKSEEILSFLLKLYDFKSMNIPFIPENNGGVNWEKCGGRNSGGCPLSSKGRKFALKLNETKKKIKILMDNKIAAQVGRIFVSLNI